jgi:hypothetical protein
MIPNEIIIIGGGASIQEGINLGLKEQIQDKCVIACNYAFKHFSNTFVCFLDRKFYHPEAHELKQNPNIYEELKTLPLLIGINKDNLEQYQLDNTILLKSSKRYERENAVKNGWYDGNLSGILALGLASYLLNYSGTIYLLGFDWTKNNTSQTHYYDNIKHHGVGKVSYYIHNNPNNYFKYFDKEPNLKIYNVSLNSSIENFEKISYEKMFELLNKEVYNQEELRKEIKQKLHSSS